MTTTVLPAGTTTYSVHTTVAAGDVLEFPSGSTTTLVMDHSNLIILGTLRMRPNNPAVIHTLQFLCEDESFGAGGGIVVVATDIGLWVMENGQLDIVGSTKVGWNNTGTDPTWLAGDSIFRAPNAPPDAGTAWYASALVHVPGDPVPSVTAPTGQVFPTEVFNLTRNVRIVGQAPVGTVHHRTHVFIRSTQPQTIKYAMLQWVAPRKYNPTVPGNNDYSKVVLGRWALHFHDNMDGSRGSIVEGVVIRNFGGHGFVPHMSHGVSFIDCVAFGGNASGFWWDLDDSLSSDILWDHCFVNTIAPFRDLQISSAPGFSLSEGGGSGIVDGRGSNIIRNCVATGVRGGQNNAGFMWTTLADPSIGSTAHSETWTTENNIAHNNLNSGVFIWYNMTSKHLIEDQVCYHNGRDSVLHGAYAVTFMFERLLCFDNVRQFEIHAVSHYPDQTHGMPGSFIRDSYIEGLVTSKHEVPSGLFPPPKPRYTVIDTTLTQAITIHDWEDQATTPLPGIPPPGNQEEIYIDFVRCLDAVGNDIEYTDSGAHPTYGDFTLSWMHPLSQWRVQRRNGTAYQLTEAVPSGALVSTPIAPFFFYVTTATLAQATNGAPYTQSLASALGTGTITWRLKSTSDPLPTGLSLSSAGVISGTPSSGAGSFPITVEAVSSTGEPDIVAPRDFTLAVGTGGVVQTVQTGLISQTPVVFTPSVSIATLSVLNITTAALDDAEVGANYSFTMSVEFGLAPYLWSVTSGTLPDGLSISGTGVISGIPTTVETQTVTIQVADFLAHLDTVTLDLEILAPVVIEKVIEVLPFVVYPVPVASGSGSPILPVNRQEDDILLLFTQSWSGDPAIAAPTNWTEVPISPKTNTSTSNGSRLGMFWKRCDMTETSPLSIPNPGDHRYAVTMAIRGCLDDDTPLGQMVGGVNELQTTSFTLPSITTTASNRLIIFAMSRGNDLGDSEYTGWTNDNLEDLHDDWTDGGTTTGRGGGLAATAGAKITAGPIGTTTVNISSAVRKTYMVVALRALEPVQALPPATLGKFYSYTFTASNGIPPYEFSEVQPGTLPDGMTLSSEGVLSGNPTVIQDDYAFGITVIDSVNISDGIGVTLTVRPALRRVGRSLSVRAGSRYVSVG